MLGRALKLVCYKILILTLIKMCSLGFLDNVVPGINFFSFDYFRNFIGLEL